MIELLMVVAMPFIVSLTTSGVKRLRAIANANGWRVPVLRALVAVFSLLGAIATVALDGGTLDEGVIETTALAVFNAIAATFIYFKGKKMIG